MNSLFECNHCGLHLQNEHMYVRRIINHKDVANIVFKCPFSNCFANLSSVGSLKSHMSYYHKKSGGPVNYVACDSRLKCEVFDCHFATGDQFNFIKHLNTHINDRVEIVCPFFNCKLLYKNTCSFKSHIFRKHKDEGLLNMNNNNILVHKFLGSFYNFCIAVRWCTKRILILQPYVYLYRS